MKHKLGFGKYTLTTFLGGKENTFGPCVYRANKAPVKP